MTLTATIKFLYAVSGFAAVLLYLPQVFKAWKDREHALSLSLVSFGGWCIGSLITALYAWLLLKDRIFTAVSMGNLAGSGAVFLIAANNRLDAGRDRGSTFGGPARHEAHHAAGLAQNRTDAEGAGVLSWKM